MRRFTPRLLVVDVRGCGASLGPLQTCTWLGASLLSPSIGQKISQLWPPALSPWAEACARGMQGCWWCPRQATCRDCKFGWHKLSLVTTPHLNCSRFEHQCSFFWESLCFRQSFSTSFYTTRVHIIPPTCLQADSRSGALTTLLPKGQPD